MVAARARARGDRLTHQAAPHLAGRWLELAGGRGVQLA